MDGEKRETGEGWEREKNRGEEKEDCALAESSFP